MPFFDLHCHPSFKSALSDLDVNNCPSPIPPVDVNGTGLLAPCINLIAGGSLEVTTRLEKCQALNKQYAAQIVELKNQLGIANKAKPNAKP